MSLSRSAKRNWVVTYGAAKGYISFQMFREEGLFDVDEVHSTSDGSLVYTYFHLKRQGVRQHVIMGFMQKMKDTHGIVLSNVFGYNAVNGPARDESLMDHIAIKMLYEHMKVGNPAFVPCTDGEPVVKRGFLLRYDGVAMIRAVLSKRATALIPALDDMEKMHEKLTVEYNELSDRFDVLLEEHSLLKMHNEALLRKNGILAGKYDQLKRAIDNFKPSIPGDAP